jgi:hypothetical protein
MACSAIPNLFVSDQSYCLGITHHNGERGAFSMISCNLTKIGLSIGKRIVLSARDPVV